MGLVRAFAAEERAITRESLKLDQWGQGDLDLTGETESGITVTPLDSLAQSTLYSCVMLRAEVLMSMPVQAYVADGDRRRPVPGPRWLERPNPEEDWATYIGGVSWSVDLYGNVFEVVIRDGSNRVAELWMIDPARVRVRRDPGGPKEYWIDGELFTGEIRHRWLHRLPGKLIGATPIEHAAESIGLALATQKFGARYFADGHVPAGILSMDGAATPDQLREVKKGWLGLLKKGRRLPVVLQGGLKYQQVSVSPNESQFLDTRRFSAAEVCAIYRVPPEFVAIGVEGSSLLYQNVSSSWLALLRRAMMAPMRLLEQGYSELMPAGQRMRFVPDVYLKPDTKTRYEAHKTAIEAGFVTPNEVRALEDQDPHPFGDVLYAPKADTAESVSAPAEEPAVDDPGAVEDPGVGPMDERSRLTDRLDLVEAGLDPAASEVLRLLARVESRHAKHNQKDHGRKGATSAFTGMESVGPLTQERILAAVAETWGMPEEEARRLAVSNLVAKAQTGNVDDAQWYHRESAALGEMADAVGVSKETMVGMVAVTSAQMPWNRNKDIARGIAETLARDEPFELTQDHIDNYNAWVANRKQGKAFVTELAPGTYRPSELPPDLAASKTPGMPKMKNTDYVISAVELYRGASLDETITGPKQRSFVNNLVDPSNPNYVTADTWHYEAMGGDHPFTKTVKGVEYSAPLTDWNSDTVGEIPKRSPQDFFQSKPAVKTEGYGSNNGQYPWVVDVTRQATDEYNAANGTNLIPSEFQALVWVAAGGGM